jgi:type VI secretion system secreted protein Hcp
MAIYMKVDGINGDATQAQHKDWIGINSFQWGVGRGISTPVGSAKNREASEPSVSEVVITKPLDSASVLLCQEAVVGKEGKTVKIDFCRTDKEGAAYLQVILTNTLISGYSTSSGGDAPTESLTLNFTKIELSETGPNEKNGAGNPTKFAYDIATAGS